MIDRKKPQLYSSMDLRALGKAEKSSCILRGLGKTNNKKKNLLKAYYLHLLLTLFHKHDSEFHNKCLCSQVAFLTWDFPNNFNVLIQRLS